MVVDFDPFSLTGPAEVPLARAPLVRVIAQVRFPPVASLGRADFMAPFQEELRRRYPILTPQRTAGFMLGPQGVVLQNSDGIVWRFRDKPAAWHVSLGTDFVALEATSYSDRDDFMTRLEEVLRALEKTAEPAIYVRLGLRYINRVTGAEFAQLSDLLRAEVLGLSASSIPGLTHSICESRFTKGDTALATRWGRLPAGATTDPAALEPVGEPSWVLDLDMFRAAQKDFDVKALADDTRDFARTIHDFFRWCVTPKFLEVYGGKS